MENVYFKIPLEADLITSRKQLKRCSLNDSVAGMIHLIAITHFGENRQDNSFGNELWEHDFVTIENVQAFKEKLSESIQKCIITHEKRLTAVKVNIGFEQVLTTAINRRIRQKIDIHVEGILCKTNEKFVHHEFFFVGPLSYY